MAVNCIDIVSVNKMRSALAIRYMGNKRHLSDSDCNIICSLQRCGDIIVDEDNSRISLYNSCDQKNEILGYLYYNFELLIMNTGDKYYDIFFTFYDCRQLKYIGYVINIDTSFYSLSDSISYIFNNIKNILIRYGK